MEYYKDNPKLRNAVLILLREYYQYPGDLGSDEEVLNWFYNYAQAELSSAENIASELEEIWS